MDNKDFLHKINDYESEESFKNRLKECKRQQRLRSITNFAESNSIEYNAFDLFRLEN